MIYVYNVFMNNKQLFQEGEADEFFLRNKDSHKNNKNLSISTLSDWLSPFKNEINNILEIGCGNGQGLNLLSKNLEAKGHGIEPSEKAVKFISNTYPNIDIIQGFADNIDFDKEFDLIHIGFLLYLVDRNKYLRCIAEADRLLRMGGFLSIIDFETPHPYSNEYSHKKGIFSHKLNNSNVFVASGLYSIVNKYHYSHSKFSFDKKIDERVSLTLLFKETEIFKK